MSLARAIETGDLAELPSRRDEDWKWTDLRGLIRAMPPASERIKGDAARGPVARYSGLIAPGPFDAVADSTITLVNGDREHLTLHSGEKGAITVALRFVAIGAGAHAAAATIVVPPGSLVALLESYEGQGEAYVRAANLRIEVSAGAGLQRIVLADDVVDGVTVSEAEVTLGARSAYVQTVITGGARRQRLETHLRHAQGAYAQLDGAYVLSGARHADITTVVEHDARDASTSQLIKGCVRDQARAVFQGRIVVARGADGTDAKMGHHALVLSERAEVDAKPELEIYADDVACSHGNTVGALDEEALFYIRQRGVPDAEARALLTEAFVGEVIDGVEHKGAREIARAWAAERLKASA